ncbi:MAG: tripartite tricarboxylate transporter substrate binding protein [Burkholderiales bacterium]
MRHEFFLTIVPAFVMAVAPLSFAQDHSTNSGQAYPSKPVRIIVGYTPGGGTDLLGRIVGKKLGELWGQQVVVDNRPGAGGNIATDLVAKAPPDGYTLLIAPSTHAIVPNLYSKLPFDTLKDFTFITLIAASPNILVVHPSVPVTTVKELIALAKRRPGELTFASAGIGATTHLAGEYFKNVAGINVLHIPYKGSSQAQIDLIGGHVSFMVDSMPSGLPKVQAGKTRALATTGKQRYRLLPGVPTVLESGLQYESISWWGVIGPANMPQSVVNKLLADITRSMALPDVKELVVTQGAEATTNTPQQFMDYVKQETALYGKIIKAANIRIE